VSRLLLVAKEQSVFSSIVPVIEEKGGDIHWADSGEQAISAIGRKAMDAIVVDEKLEDTTGLALIEKIVSINPMINSALVSSLNEKAYHEASEGLGILMQLPPEPKETDGRRLMSKLNQILGFTTSVADESKSPSPHS
jgi:DNA-binding NtrC family response regulator